MLSATTFEDLIPQLTSAIEWFGESDVQISPTRLGHYRRLLAEILELQQTLDRRQAAAKFTDYVNALFCAHDIAAIHTAFKDGAHKALIQSRLRQSVGGAILLRDENASASGNFARNIEFELIAAAHLLTGDAVLLESNACDVIASVQGVTALIECKRLQSERGVEAALSKAKAQLRVAYDTCSGANHVGFVAFDITKTCIAGSQPLRVAEARDVDVWTMERIHSFLEHHISLWNRIEDERIGAIIVRLCAMGEIGLDETNLLHCQHYGVARLERGAAVQAAVDGLTLALQRGISRTIRRDTLPRSKEST
jgi:hypothetical protein